MLILFKEKKTTQRHRKQYGDYQKKRELERHMVVEKDLTWDAEYIIQYTDDIL